MNKKDNPRSRFAQMMLLRAGSTIASNGSSERSTPSVPYEAVAAASRNWLLIPVVRGIANQPIGIDRATSDLTQRMGQRFSRLPMGSFDGSTVRSGRSGGRCLCRPRNCTSSCRYGVCPETLRAYTGGKMLAFFRFPSDLRVREEGTVELAPGLVVRGEGELVVLPSGENWPDMDAWVLEAPEWLRICAFEPDDEEAVA